MLRNEIYKNINNNDNINDNDESKLPMTAYHYLLDGNL